MPRSERVVAPSDRFFFGEELCALSREAGLWDQGVFPHFCDTRESPPLYWGLVFGKPCFCITEVGISHSPAVKGRTTAEKGPERRFWRGCQDNMASATEGVPST